MARKTMQVASSEQAARDRELDAWMDRALRSRKPDPVPDLHDV